jgi:hypothetical protein
MGDRMEKFIRDTMNPDNFELWKKVRDQKRLEDHLTHLIRTRYLQFDRPNNWLEQQMAGYMHDSHQVLRAQWSRFRDPLAREQHGTADKVASPNLPIDALAQVALDVIKGAIAGMVTGAATLALMVTVPVLNILGALVLLVGLPFLTHNMAAQRERAVKATRDEMLIQRPGVAMDLLNTILDGAHAQLKQRFMAQLSEREAVYTGQATVVEQGIGALDTVIDKLERIAYAQSGKEQ